MEKYTTVLEIVIPIFVTLLIGMMAKRKSMITEEEARGLQQFVTRFALPCVLFNSCLTADFSAESFTSMALVFPVILGTAVWSFQARKKTYPYYNLPMMFCAQESGMLGIPLFMTLFGVEQAYRMGVLDVAQSFIAIPVIALLAAGPGDNPSVSSILKKVVQSPLLIMSIIGLTLNFTGWIDLLNGMGIGTVITETTGFLAQPVSAVILFSVGYNFSLGEGNRKVIFKLCVFRFVLFAIIGAAIQGILCLLPSVESETRWALLLYCALPASYLSAGFGRNKEEKMIASGVCSILTVVCLVIFCVIAAFTA